MNDLEDLHDRAEDDDDINNRDPIFNPVTAWIDDGKEIITNASNPTSCIETGDALQSLTEGGTRQLRNLTSQNLERYPIYIESNIRGVSEIWGDIYNSISTLQRSASCNEERAVIAAAREARAKVEAEARAKAAYEAAREEALREFNENKTRPIIENFTFTLEAGSWVCAFRAENDSRPSQHTSWAMLIGGLKGVEITRLFGFQSVGSNDRWAAHRYTPTDIPTILHGYTDQPASLRYDGSQYYVYFTLEKPTEIVVSLRSSKTSAEWTWSPKTVSLYAGINGADCEEKMLDEDRIRIVN